MPLQKHYKEYDNWFDAKETKKVITLFLNGWYEDINKGFFVLKHNYKPISKTQMRACRRVVGIDTKARLVNKETIICMLAYFYLLGKNSKVSYPELQDLLASPLKAELEDFVNNYIVHNCPIYGKDIKKYLEDYIKTNLKKQLKIFKKANPDIDLIKVSREIDSKIKFSTNLLYQWQNKSTELEYSTQRFYTVSELRLWIKVADNYQPNPKIDGL